ncbi:MAG: carbon starvation protein A [Akkermansiaceae bacterium]|jgi:carbon starvation protein|nr:carbon starvation protein A [Akkermansiaceae bacterium]MDP4645514.1 carbon starvation protein A [Akkermansiaceae bacterium]MDP4719857.1 carbon starvation protein A [Akkermansiaceae bacterium]MDP4778679.1 carbon starvation protein A [Akkermansiaceae bacterium]MDP4848271.1 carbon starvation protein A [Akkermansiaceae bacterium]
MQTLLIALASLIAYFIAYHTYGRWLSRKIFKLDASNTAPSIECEDGDDFVPTSKGVVFGHHFTSIAGTGPIVGPALAVIWGWLPALLWVLFGSIFIGAVHDFGALVISMRNKGQTVGDISGRVLSPRTRILFLSILFMALTIVLAIFGLVIAAIFKMFPSSIFPCLIQIPIAVIIGAWLHRKGINLLAPSLFALAVMYLSVAYGDWGFLHAFNTTLAGWPIIAWVGLLLLYSYIASVLPVWILLQPRDYINSLQLLSAIGLVVVGLFIAGIFGFQNGGERMPLEIVAPAIRIGADAPSDAPWIFPFLFVTIACGAISGFHCLVSSGTSSKQLKCETDAQFVGYGSMLTEGFLAVLVILACVAGISLGVPEMLDGKATGDTLTGSAAYSAKYDAWGSASKGAISAFVEGSANFIRTLGLPGKFAVALMGVFVASFAATTMDSACRLQRYVTQELGEATGIKPLTNKHSATIFAILIAGAIAAMPAAGESWQLANLGKGGLILWPLFGAVNQLLGGLAFLVILFWMWRRNLPIWFVAIPAAFMLVLPAVAMISQLFVGDGAWISGKTPNPLLAAIGIATLALEAWILIEAAAAWPKAKGLLEQPA